MGNWNRVVRACSLFLVVGVVTVSGLDRIRGMRIVALTPLLSRNAWVVFSMSCVGVVELWGSCIKRWSIHAACSWWCVSVY